jgi:hypothetical protein
MTSPTSHSKLYEDLATLIFGLCIALSLWQPDLRWPMWIGIAVLVLAVAVRPFVDTEADRVRRRKNLWLIPAAMGALAIQLVWTAGADSRPRTILLSLLLVGAGVALFVQRRRAI